MTKTEFDNYYNFTSIKQCCFFCKHGEGWIDFIECHHPLRNVNDNIYVEATDVCDEFVKKESDDWDNE